MKKTVLAPLVSAFVLPGLGQLLNHQLVKGVIFIALTTVVFLSVFIKLLIDVSAVMTILTESPQGWAQDFWPRLLEGLRTRNMGLMLGMIGFGVALWAASTIDAYIQAKRQAATEPEAD